MMSERERRRAWIAFGIALAVITIFRVRLIDSIADRSFFGKYFDFADALRAGTIPRDRIPDLSPGYLWTIALLRAIGFGVQGIRTLQIVMLSGVAAIAARIAGGRAGVVAAILVLGSKAALVNATDLEPEIFLLLFSALGLLLILECGGHAAALGSAEKSGGMAAALQIGAGLSFGLATTFRPVALLASFALLAWLAVKRRKPIAFAIGFIVPVLAVLLVNRAMTGSMLLMDPGTVFYEGMNPNASGYAGVAPRIVKDIEQTIPGSDTMHVAYRVVASRAMRTTLSREEANRYWSQKSIAFMATYPLRALRLGGRKIRLLVSAHDAYDVPSMVLKERALGGWWISWALLVPLAAYGMTSRRSPVEVVLYTVCAAASPIVFFVTTRHRLPLLIGLVVLASIGAVSLVERRAYVAGALIALAAIGLSIPGDLQREDDYLWTATFEVSQAMTTNERALAATWLPESVPQSPPDILRATAVRELSGTTSPARSFSIAIAILQAGDAAAADQILQKLQALNYHPYRRTRAVSSVAYYRARALLQLGRPADARAQAAGARSDAPGDADVLAMSAFAERDPRFARQLDRLHDPFTRDWALARAAFATGDPATARRLASRAAAGCPEWPLPHDLR